MTSTPRGFQSTTEYAAAFKAQRRSIPSSPTAVHEWGFHHAPSKVVPSLEDASETEELESLLDDLLLREHMRRRQRQYERRYRAKKKSENYRARKLWLDSELKIYDLLQKRAVAMAANPCEKSLKSRYLLLCAEQQAILRDSAMLGCVYRWSQAFDLRNYCTDECMRTRPQWAAVERQILGAASIRPFCLPHFRFEW